MTDITSHGIGFVRTGECSQCGACGCEPCPHLGYKHKKPVCEIYETRGDLCSQCGTTHQGCIDFPDNPWIYNVRDGVCAFSFERQDSGDMDDLPFLDGQSWYRGA